MTEEEGEDEPKQNKRFRLSRKVKKEPTAIDTAFTPSIPEEDEADRGSPEMNAAVGRGCNGCLKVTGLLFLIMFTSLIGTCAYQSFGSGRLP